MPLPFRPRRALSRLALSRLTMACLLGALALPAGAAEIDLPAQPLDQAVTELARQTGLTIGGDAGLLRGHRAPALSGDYAPLDALRRLLAGTRGKRTRKASAAA